MQAEEIHVQGCGGCWRLGDEGWGADAPPAMIPLTALLLRCHSALGKCTCCFVPESPSASRGIALGKTLPNGLPRLT